MHRVKKRTMRSRGVVRHYICYGEWGGEDPKRYRPETSQTVSARPSSLDNSGGMVGYCEE